MKTPYLDSLMARYDERHLTGGELVGALINNFIEADVEAAFERISPELGAQLQNVLLRVARGDATFSDLGAPARTAVKAFVGRKAWEPLSWKVEITLEQT